MNRDEVKQLLLNGEVILIRDWTFTELTMGCINEDNCCYDTFNDIEDTLDSIEHYSNGFKEIKVL